MVAGAVILAALGFLLYEGLGNALDYYEPVNQAVATRAQLGSSTFRMEGVVVPGTVRKTTDGTDFSIRAGGVTERVVNIGTPPQLFQPNIKVVVVGHFSGEEFLSNQIMVKHSSDYIPESPKQVRSAAGSSH